MKPKIILFDLEIIPNLSKALKYWTELSCRWETKTLKASVSSICSAGWKQIGTKRVSCINAWDFPKWKKDVNDDKEVCKAIYEVLHNADAVITWNGIKFDWKYLQTRLLYHKLPLLAKVNHIDLCHVAKRNLMMVNNRLGTVGHELMNEKKLSHQGWDLWVGTHGRVKKDMKLMSDYCKQDVALLEKCYYEMLPLVTNLPNLNLYRSLPQMIEGRKVCPNCGGESLRSNGYRHTKTKSYQRLICSDCHTWSRVDIKGGNPRTL